MSIDTHFFGSTASVMFYLFSAVPGVRTFQASSIPLFYLSITQDIKMYCCRQCMLIGSVAGLWRLWSTMAIDEHYFGAIVAAMVYTVIRDYVTHGVCLVLENKFMFAIRTGIKNKSECHIHVLVPGMRRITSLEHDIYRYPPPPYECCSSYIPGI